MSVPKTNMTTLFDNLKRLTCTYLDNESFFAFLQTNKSHSQCAPKIVLARKASKLLFYVVNINVERKKKILELIALESKKRSEESKKRCEESKTQAEESKTQSEAQSIILMPATAEEFFYNTTQCKKLWSDISPLQAAAKCGDFHLVQLMVDSLSDKQKSQALLQLDLVRIPTVMSEPGSYIQGLVELRKAYKDFHEPYAALVAANNWDELDRLSGLLGDAVRNLPNFLLQVFFNPVPHSPLPDFTKEPERVCIVYIECAKEMLNINSIGGSTSYAPYKGPWEFAFLGQGGQTAMKHWHWNTFDSMAIDSLYAVLPTELDKIIDSLPLEIDSLSLEIDSSAPQSSDLRLS